MKATNTLCLVLQLTKQLATQTITHKSKHKLKHRFSNIATKVTCTFYAFKTEISKTNNFIYLGSFFSCYFWYNQSFKMSRLPNSTRI